MNQKGFSQLILIVIVGAVIIIAGGSTWYYKQSAEQNKSTQGTLVVSESSDLGTHAAPESSSNEVTSSPIDETNQNTVPKTPIIPTVVPKSMAPMIGGCQVFPSDSPWNTDISQYPVHADSAKIIDRLAQTWDIVVYPIKPYNVVDETQPLVPVHYQPLYSATSDPGPMPIPQDALYMQKTPGLNSLGQPKKLDDNHLMVVSTNSCKLYELWSIAGANADGSWNAGSGSIYDLTSNALRPFNAAASSASGLPIFAGLVRSDEVKAGAIHHALTMTTTYTSPGYILPATKYQPPFGKGADWDNPYNPSMGMRIRLKQSYDISGLTSQARIVAAALQQYGAFINDGSPGSGQMSANPDPYFNIKDLSALKQIPASAFEVVYTGEKQL